MSRRDLLQAGLAAGAALSAWPLLSPYALRGEEVGQPKRGGILRVRGWDPAHFDPQWKYYVYLRPGVITGSWQPYVKNYAPNQTFDYGSRAAALWLDR